MDFTKRIHDEVDTSGSSGSSTHYQPPSKKKEIKIPVTQTSNVNEEEEDWGSFTHTPDAKFSTPDLSPFKEPQDAGRFPSPAPPPPDPPAKDRQSTVALLLAWSEGHGINGDLIQDQHKIHDSVILKKAHVVQKDKDRHDPVFNSEMTYFLQGAGCQSAALSADRYESTIERMTNLLAEHTRALRSIKDDNKQLVQNSLKIQVDLNKTISDSRALASQLDKTVSKSSNFCPLPTSVSSALSKKISELNFLILDCPMRVIFGPGGVELKSRAQNEAQRILIQWSAVLKQLTADDIWIQNLEIGEVLHDLGQEGSVTSAALKERVSHRK